MSNQNYENAALREQVAKLTARVSELSAHLESAKGTIKFFENQCAKLAQDNTNLQDIIAQKDAKNKQLRDQIARMMSRRGLTDQVLAARDAKSL